MGFEAGAVTSRLTAETWRNPEIAKSRSRGHKAAWRKPGYKAKRFIRTAIKAVQADQASLGHSIQRQAAIAELENALTHLEAA